VEQIGAVVADEPLVGDVQAGARTRAPCSLWNPLY
jgi:hypothetical protein